MNRIVMRSAQVFAALLLLPLIIVGCDISGIGQEVEETFDLIVQLPSVETSVSGQFVDAESGEVIDQQNVAVTIKGPDKSAVIDPILFEPITEATVEDGFVDLALREEITPTTAAPVRFSVVAEADGYITNSKSFVVEETGKYRFKVRLVAEDRPPNGVSVKSSEPSGSASSDGTVTEEQTVATDPEPETGGTASITVAEGTKVTDVQGRPLQGALSSTVAYYANQNEEALAAFPGGFEDVTVRMDDGVEVSGGTFVSGSFVSVDLQDGAGRTAHQFSQPVEMSVTVPEGTTNPETGQPVREGDVVPLWSYNDETGVWVREATTVAGKRQAGVALRRADTGGKLTATFDATHFSYWNLGWFTPAEQQCTAGTQVQVSGNSAGAVLSYVVSGSGYTSTIETGASSFTVDQFPASMSALNVKAKYEGEIVGATQVNQPCGQMGNISLSGMPSKNEMVTVKIDISITCGQQEVRPSVDFRYRRKGASGAWNTASLENGKATVEGLVLDETYEVSVTYNDDGTQKTVTEEVKVEGEPNEEGVIEIDRDFANIDEVCDNI